MKKQITVINKEVSKGQMFECKSKNLNFFTYGKRYEVESTYYDNGGESFTITLIDEHPLCEKNFNKGFNTSKIQ